MPSPKDLFQARVAEATTLPSDRPGVQPASALTRRGFLVAGALTAGALVAGCSTTDRASAAPVGPNSRAVQQYADRQRRPGAAVRSVKLRPEAGTIDLGGTTVRTWSFGSTLPGQLIRASVGETLRVTVDNDLPAPTTVHWHGLRVPNNMDGVPGVTQDAIRSGQQHLYQFTATDPGTYWYHSHVGLQLDRGLYGPLIIDDPNEPAAYDAEWVVVLDDWLDGVGDRAPDAVLKGLQDMSGMAMGMSSSLLGGDAGDVRYPHYLVNGRQASNPETFRARPGQRVRIRIINAGGDTAFRVAVGGHRLTVTHTDGYPVQPVTVDTLLIGMGERYDVIVTMDDGAFPFVAMAEGKHDHGLGVIRTSSGKAPKASARVKELDGRLLRYADLRPQGDQLPAKKVDRFHTVRLGGQMMPYQWTINSHPYASHVPLPIRQGERVRLRYTNKTSMFHPMHLHGHTFALRGAGNGVRKDTVIVFPKETVDVDVEADNPGQWVTHCHNAYHMEAGMMTVLSYRD